MAWSESARSNDSEAIGWRPWLGILFCMVTARSTAMAFNRLVDRRLDAENPRTARRHLPAGLLSIGSVSLFTAASAVGFVASTLLFLPNRLPLYFSLPVLAFLCGYSFAKRFTSLAHFWLGAALMLAPVSAWIAPARIGGRRQSGRSAAGTGVGRGGAAVGGRVRHHLCLPGR